ncbi:MAG: hypothetical protein HQK58_10330 [Deltaproteobacteria bacterium]|nr:hypothetical protein [Deltaproteobacteria bacterium]
MQDGTALYMSGMFMDGMEDADLVRQSMAQGLPWQASIRINPVEIEPVPLGQTVNVNGRAFTGPGEIWRKSRLREISFCIAGADSTTAVIAAKEGNNTGIIPNPGVKMDLKTIKEQYPDIVRALSDEAITAFRANELPGILKEAMDKSEAKGREIGLSEEKTRVKEILSTAGPREVAVEAVLSDKSPYEAVKAMLAAKPTVDPTALALSQMQSGAAPMVAGQKSDEDQNVHPGQRLLSQAVKLSVEKNIPLDVAMRTVSLCDPGLGRQLREAYIVKEDYHAA